MKSFCDIIRLDLRLYEYQAECITAGSPATIRRSTGHHLQCPTMALVFYHLRNNVYLAVALAIATCVIIACLFDLLYVYGRD